MSMIVAPTIITLIDQDQDISIFLNLTEEEEETHTKKELKIYTNTNASIFLKKVQKKKNIVFLSKNYTSQYLKIATPPPDFFI